MNTKLHNVSTVIGSSAIKTFAFFDLETTGLPDLEFFKTKITELSVVAVSVEHLLEAKDAPRVQHKLTLCFNPFKRIDLKATEVTGLDNDLLEHHKKFDKNAMNLLECFLFQLQQPVCLIAHNGNHFDFPLIKKQCEVLDGSFPFSIKCCDSLPVFQQIDDLMAKKLETLRKESYSLQEWNDALDDGLVINPELEQLLDSESLNEPDAIFHNYVKKEIEQIEKLERENRKPTDVDDMKLRQVINEQTPDKPTKPANLQPNDQRVQEQKKRAMTSKRELFPSTSAPKTRQWTKGKYTLREIYKRFYHSHPENSHDAESDVVSLLKCAIACKFDFVKIVNENCIEFKDVKRF